MLVAALVLALSSTADSATKLELVKRPTGASASPTVGIYIEPSEKSAHLLRLYRKTSWKDGKFSTNVWTAYLSTLDEPDKRIETTSDACPAIAAQADKLTAVPTGGLLTPPDLSPPQAVLHATVYTVWGAARQDNGRVSRIEVKTTSGPVAEWAAAMYATALACFPPGLTPGP